MTKYSELPTPAEMVTLNPIFVSYDAPYLHMRLEQKDENGDPELDENNEPLGDLTWAYNMDGLAYVISSNQTIIDGIQQTNDEMQALIDYLAQYIEE